MKPCIAVLLLAGIFALLSSVAVALLFSIDAGRPSWILAGILIVDSVALFLIGACMLLRRDRGVCYLRSGARG